MFKKFLFTFSCIIAITSFANEVIYQNERFTLYSPSSNFAIQERNTSLQTQREIRTRRIQRFSLNQLNANSIQAAYHGPLKNKSKVTIIIPQYVSTSNIMFPSKKTLCTQISGRQIKQLYSDILNDSNRLSLTVYDIFRDTNGEYANYKLFGKDKFGRNVAYVYNLGYENTGIVFYPDKFRYIFYKMYKSWSTLGWNTFVENFIDIICYYNKHLDISKHFISGEYVYIIKYK